ncbi:roadblock/LC7 domain-containing protein [Streptomyces sp. NPDC047042]|uniref:roadblock/LC7 domain-containing protein n=1 Tax=Streptomyces sp. NPDC047042 TaxID=3154807 RepID=UPI0034082046
MSAPKSSPAAKDMSWVLDPLLDLPGVVHALVLSADGLIQGHDPFLDGDAAEGAAGMMSALQGAARAVARELSGEAGVRLRQVVIDADCGFVFAIPAGENTVLAVFTEPKVDMGLVTHHMQIQVATLGTKVMNTQARDSGNPA